VEGGALTAELGQSAAHGTLTLFGDGSFLYQPTLHYFGPDTFTYRAKDASGAYSTFATVHLQVNPVNNAPVARDINYETRGATPLEAPAPGVLQNDSDVEGAPLTAVLRRLPSQGTLTLQSNGAFRYTPRVGFTGTDTFVYRASDGSLESNDATVFIVVNAEHDVDVRAFGMGSVVVTGGKASFLLDVRRSNGRVRGALIYLDPVRTRWVTSTRITSIEGTGRSARILGQGRLPNGTVVDFVVDLLDEVKPGRSRDTFRIELSTGPVSSGVLSSGNLRVIR
jgi:hypothetical protein